MAPSDTVLDPLDRRITAALHVDGRATWRRIAAVLGEPERTVARRGGLLLDSGRVAIHGLADPGRMGRGEQYVLRADCAPGSAWTAAVAIARRPETVFGHVLFGAADCVADIWCPPHRAPALFLRELAATPGITRMATAPVLRYIRTLHDWDPGLLAPCQIDALRAVSPVLPWPADPDGGAAPVPRQDRVLITALAEDGRRPYEELARLAGVSEQTARRRVEALRRDGTVAIRAVVDPALLGLPVGAVLWIRARPDRVEPIAARLAAAPYVRYAASLVGDAQIVADVRLASRQRLWEVLTTAPWLADTTALESALITESLKQSDILSPALRP